MLSTMQRLQAGRLLHQFSSLRLACVSTSSRVTALKTETAESFWEKNKRLKRPLSPHLSIYKPQATSMLSITHRVSGAYMYVVLAAVGGGAVILPSSFPDYLNMVATMPYGGAAIALAKLAITWPFVYHGLNGARHLSWDLGYGFGIKTLYQTGYSVLIASIVLAAAIVTLVK